MASRPRRAALSTRTAATPERPLPGLVRWLLAAYPAAYRDAFAQEIQEVVRRQWRERAGDRSARRRFLALTVVDLARHAIGQWAEQIHRGLVGARASRRLAQLEPWADGWALATTAVVWVAFVANLAYPGFEWGFFGVAGSGADGAFVALGLLTLFALSVPAANAFGGRRARCGLRAVWLGFWSVKLVAALTRWGPETAFRGDAWGIRLPVLWLLVPTLVLTVATVWRLAVTDQRDADRQKVRWRSRGLGALAATALVPLQQALFAAGEGGLAGPRLAILLTVIQWTVLWLAVFRPPGSRRGRAESGRSRPVSPVPPLPSEVSR